MAATTAPMPSSGNLRSNINASETPEHILLIHKALRHAGSELLCAARALPPTAPDADLTSLLRAVDHLSAAFRAHCDAEDSALLPVLQERLVALSSSSSRTVPVQAPSVPSGQPPPLKRTRTRPPACDLEPTEAKSPSTGHFGYAPDDVRFDPKSALDTLSECVDEHHHVPHLFASLRSAICACLSFRTAPRATGMERVVAAAVSVSNAIVAHLDAEEKRVLPIFSTCLSEKEQGKVLVQVALATFSGKRFVGGTRQAAGSSNGDGRNAEPVPSVSRQFPATNTPSSPSAAEAETKISIGKNVAANATLRALSMEDMVAFLRPLHACADADEFEAIVKPFSLALPRERWEALCAVYPRLRAICARPDNPLIEITYLHKAIRAELGDLVSYCVDIDIDDDLQLQSVSKRLAFLRKVHACHSEGEDIVLLKELNLRLAKSVPSSSTGLPTRRPPVFDFVSATASSPVDSDSSAGASVVGTDSNSRSTSGQCKPQEHSQGALSASSGVFHAEHSEEVRLFDVIAAHVTLLRAQLTSSSPVPAPPPSVRKDSLVSCVRDVSSHLIKHMDQEESNLLPLVREHFTIADQDIMMRRVMAHVPASFLPELIPWVVFTLSVDDQESLVRNVLRTASREEFLRTTAIPLADAVAHGMYDAAEWNELCVRIPELLPDRNIRNGDEEVEDDGPVSEVLRVHKAIRVELHALLRAVASLPDKHVPNARAVDVLAERVSFLGRMVGEHSKAEDLVLLPSLEERSPGISKPFSYEHHEERELFSSLSSTLQQLQCCMDDEMCGQLVRKARILTRTLRDEMVEHLKMEEMHLWPFLTSNFSKSEQAEIVARIFGLMPSERFQELLPWMLRVLSVPEQATMMTHILQVTKSTMFETWLNTWFPHLPGTSESCAPKVTEGSSCDESKGPGPRPSRSQVSPLCRHGNVLPVTHATGKRTTTSWRDSRDRSQATCAARSPPTKDVYGPGDVGEETASAAAALVLLRGRDNMVRAIKEIARDSSLSIDARSRMMQQVMLAPWSQKEGRGSSAMANNTSHNGTACCSSGRESMIPNNPSNGSISFGKNRKDTPQLRNISSLAQGDRSPSYRDESRTVLGCSHYARACKLLAACCNKLYTCRLCHDASEAHVMDRTATEYMLCMFCSTLQPVASTCNSPECGKSMARYYCSVCRFFDDDTSRSKYHCAFCNVCRVGKGLGVDRQHCMRCNACMSIHMANNHVCVERAMESDCPVCHQYLFSSTTPVSYLKCGHLMHSACKAAYVKKGNFSCPVCSKSLEELAPVFKKLDHLLAGESMPREYRSARCDLYCHDCSRSSTVAYHFLYNKCPYCSSYNTRVERVDPNAAR